MAPTITSKYINWDTKVVYSEHELDMLGVSFIQEPPESKGFYRVVLEGSDKVDLVIHRYIWEYTLRDNVCVGSPKITYKTLKNMQSGVLLFISKNLMGNLAKPSDYVKAQHFVKAAYDYSRKVRNARTKARVVALYEEIKQLFINGRP